MVVYTGLALFAGGGGLELGLKLALGEHYRTVAYVEREASSAGVLAANMERGGLDKGVIWDDVTTFTGDVVSPFVDNIDIISAGFPCQPWSVAGNRKGTEDDRWLWPHIFRLVREIRPRSVFLENVPGLLHGGIEYVLGDLASVGFDAEWTSVRASDERIGAPHRRERVFILAHTTKPRARDSLRQAGRGDGQQNVQQRDRKVGSILGDSTSRELGNSRGTRSQIGEVHAGPVTGQGSAPVAHADNAGSPSPGSGANRIGPKEDEGRAEQPQLESTGSGEQLVNPVGKRGRGWHTGGEYAEHAFPPGPSASAEWRDILSQRPDLAPAIEPEVRGVVDGVSRGLARTQQLRILGNGVVPQQAALAFQILKERIDGSTSTSK